MVDRAAGLLVHLTSLPGPEGVGDLGPSTEDLLHWMELAGLSV